MFSQIEMKRSTGTSSDDMNVLKGWIHDSDTILIGAGSGLSSSAGMTYDGPRFLNSFPDFISKYHYDSMYGATFQRYDSPEEYWAYMSRHVMLNRYGF